MARAALTVVTAVDAGVDLETPGVASAVDGHSFPDNGRTALFVVNTGASSRSVNVLIPTTVEGVAVGPKVITVPAGGRRLTGFLTGAYRQADGTVHVDYPVVEATLKATAVQIS